MKKSLSLILKGITLFTDSLKMSAVPKKKLCWHCEGSIDRQVDNCPYCGVYLHATEEEDNSSWNPPFNLKILTKEKAEEKKPEAPAAPIANQEIDAPIATTEAGPFDQIKKEVLPILFLLMGSGLFLFGIVLLLFSQDGVLTLKWNGDNWMYFLLVAVPSLFFGWRLLSDE